MLDLIDFNEEKSIEINRNKKKNKTGSISLYSKKRNKMIYLERWNISFFSYFTFFSLEWEQRKIIHDFLMFFINSIEMKFCSTCKWNLWNILKVNWTLNKMWKLQISSESYVYCKKYMRDRSVIRECLDTKMIIRNLSHVSMISADCCSSERIRCWIQIILKFSDLENTKTEFRFVFSLESWLKESYFWLYSNLHLAELRSQIITSSRMYEYSNDVK